MTASLSRKAWGALLGILAAGLASSAHSADRGGSQDHHGPTAPPAQIPARVVLPIRAYQQTTSYTCGPASILTLLRHDQRDGDELRIAREANCSPDKGTSPRDMAAWLEANGFDVTRGEGGTLRLLRENLARGIPTLVEWIDWGGHWVLVVGYDTRGTETPRDDLIIFADPADTYDGRKDGLTEFPALRFQAMWFDAFLFERPMHGLYITATPRKKPATP